MPKNQETQESVAAPVLTHEVLRKITVVDKVDGKDVLRVLSAGDQHTEADAKRYAAQGADFVRLSPKE